MKSFLRGNPSVTRRGSLRGNKSFQSIYERAKGKRYAFLGLSRARGTTHTALTVAAVLGQSGLSVIFFEKSGRNDIAQLLSAARGSEKAAPGLIRLGRVWYVCADCSLRAGELPETDCTVYDLGISSASNAVIPYCDRVFLVSGSAPWTCLEQGEAGGRFSGLLSKAKLRILRNLAKEEGHRLKNADGISISGFPYIPDALSPCPEATEIICKWI